MVFRLAIIRTLILYLLIGTGFAQADIKTGIKELDPIFEAFVNGKGETRTDALATLATLPREDNRELLQGILDGDLMYHTPSEQIVWATKEGRKFTMI